MSLSLYNKKRSFGDTPEPKGEKENKAYPELRFVIQKHDASHLHYDFRLEMDGVMKSWAVPKGPSLDPTIKRLARQVEDHPISYNSFEGTIPAGNYGAGEVIVWDKGTYRSLKTDNRKATEKEFLEGLEKGKLKFIMDGEKIKGTFTLFRWRGRGDSDNEGKNWMLVKTHDEFSTTRDITENNSSVLSKRSLIGKKEEPKKITQTIKIPKAKTAKVKKQKRKDRMEVPLPMLATLTSEAFDSDEYVFELKLDGYRALACVEDGKVNLFSRNLNNFTKNYPAVAKELAVVTDDVIFDGEIVAYGKDKKVSFQALQNLEEGGVSIEYVIFDLLYLNGDNLMDRTLIERKKMLEHLLYRYPRLTYSAHIETNGIAFFNEAKKKNFEGIMAKRKVSAYTPGKRSESWLKIKHHMGDEALIVGFTAPKGGRSHFGSLVLGQRKGKKMAFIGHVGTGYTESTLKILYQKMKPLITKTSPFDGKIPLNSPITWVKPRLIAQVKFAEWTSEGIMRQPVFLGLREDKLPEDIKREKVVSKKKILKKKPAKKAIGKKSKK